MKHDTRLGSRIAEVHNGSSLFTGDAGQGESNIRRWLIENDWLEAIVALPLNMFYNTCIATYVRVLTNRKPDRRRGNQYMKKIELLPSSLSAVEQLRIDVDQGALKFYTLPEAPTGIFHPEYSEKCYSFAATVSGNGGLDYLVVLALRPDRVNTSDGKVIDIDTAVLGVRQNSSKT